MSDSSEYYRGFGDAQALDADKILALTARIAQLEQFICATINAQPNLTAQWFADARATLDQERTDD